MSRLSSHSLGAALVLAVAALLLALPAGATGLSQSGGVDTWYVLEAGQSAEWLFQYPGNSQPALIAFGIDPDNSIRVDVYTDQQWRNMGAGQWPVEPVGRGTTGTLLGWSGEQELLDKGDLFWEAVSPKAVLFHIQLSNTTAAPARYWIAQAGPGTGQLTPYAAPALAQPAPQPTAAPAVPAKPAEQGGGGPPQTLPETGGPLPGSRPCRWR